MVVTSPSKRTCDEHCFSSLEHDIQKDAVLDEKDARVHYGVLNIRSVLPRTTETSSSDPARVRGSTPGQVPPPRRRSLRTQQRARPRTDRHRTFQTREQVVLAAAPVFRRPTINVPPMSYHPGTD